MTYEGVPSSLFHTTYLIFLSVPVHYLLFGDVSDDTKHVCDDARYILYLIHIYCVPHFSLDTSALVHHLLAEHVCDDPMHIHTHCILHLFRYQRIIHFLDTSAMMPCIFIHTIYTSFISVPVINLQSGGISSLKKYLTVTKGWRPVGS